MVVFSTPAGDIDQLKLTAKDILDRNILLIGQSGTGKTTIINDICKILTPYIDQAIVISGSEPMNHNYEQNGFPVAFIHSTFSNMKIIQQQKTKGKPAVIFFKHILDRQEMETEIYNKANNKETLYMLIKRLPSDQRSEFFKQVHKQKQEIEKVRTAIKHLKNEANRNSMIKLVDEKFTEVRQELIRKYLKANRKYLYRQKLTEEEKYTLKYLNCNPRLLIIVDDKGPELKELGKEEFFRTLFYAGRHYKITLLIATQHSTDLPPCVRTNAFINIFTDLTAVRGFFDRDSNKQDPVLSKRVLALCPYILDGNPMNFKKMIYMRETLSIHYYIAENHPPYKFGSKKYWKIAERIKANSSALSKSNPFYSKFAL